MTKFNKGDIVRVKSGTTYPALGGMVFEVIDTTIPVHGHTAIDVTGVARLTKDRYGWGEDNGSPSPDIKGWYMQDGWLELVAPASAASKAEKKAPKRRVPVEKKALTPQCRQLLGLLEAKGSVTALEASGVYRIRSLSRRITDLKEAGYTIVRDLNTDTTGQRYARYYLKGQPGQAIAA